jgi:ComF family protein
MLSHFLDLIYPPVCCACGKSLIKNEHKICTHCYLDLPIRNFSFNTNNEIAKVFWGREPIDSAAALFHFKKEGKVQRMMHEIKYGGNSSLAYFLGELFGEKLMRCDQTKKIDCILPIPLSKNKIKSRGYNQAEIIANGISRCLNIPVCQDLMICNAIKTSQTSQTGMFNRWLNVINSFEIADEIDDLSEDHLLIVDDVVTTGATIEACMLKLREVFPTMKISIGSLALSQ